MAISKSQDFLLLDVLVFLAIIAASLAAVGLPVYDFEMANSENRPDRGNTQGGNPHGRTSTTTPTRRDGPIEEGTPAHT
jgi:hypothetical protein